MSSMRCTLIGLTASLGMFATLSLSACSDDATLPDGHEPQGNESNLTPGGPAASAPVTATALLAKPFSPRSPAAQPELTMIKALSAASYELPEGLVVHKGHAYVGLAPLGTILRIAPDGTTTTYASVPAGYNNGYTLGLAFDADDNLYVAQTLNVPNAGAPAPGIYKIPPTIAGGMVSAPFAQSESMIFPNGIVIDKRGNLLVTDSATGRIHRVTAAGEVSTWSQVDELSGSPACPNVALPFPIGANGIVVAGDEVIVSNTAKGSIVKIAIDASGNAGAVTTLVKDCKYAGLDGLARDSDGTLLAAINGSPGRLARVSTNGAVTVLQTGAPLDSTGSVAFSDDWRPGQRVALVTNTAFFSVGVDGGAPNPGLLEYGIAR